MMAVEDLSGIRELEFEFHHAHLGDIETREKRDALLARLRERFPVVEAKLDTKGAWVSLFYCRR